MSTEFGGAFSMLGVDLEDLRRGQGEWRNLQEVLRRSFRALFELTSDQQQQIRRLNETVATLQQQLLIRPSTKEVTQLVDSRVGLMEKKLASMEEMSTLRAQVLEVRDGLERKASVRFVEDSLKHKLNKSDMTLAHHRALYPPQEAPKTDSEDIAQQVEAEVRKRMDRQLEKQMSECRKWSTSLFASKSELEQTQDMLSKELELKADKNSVEMDFRYIEGVMATHEKDIAAVSFKHSYPSKSCNGWSHPNPLTQQRNLSTHRTETTATTAASTRSSHTASSGRMESLLRAGREEARQEAESSRVETLESQLSDVHLSIAKVENELMTLRKLPKALEDQHQALQANTKRLHDMSSLELSIEALGEQMQACQGQLGTPFSVPMASVISNLEDRVNDLDEVLHANIREHSYPPPSGSERHSEPFSTRQQLHALDASVRSINEDVTAKMILLESEVNSLREEMHQRNVPNKTPDEKIAKSDIDFQQKVWKRLHALEKHCHMSGSKSIKSVQDLLDLVRSLRNGSAKLENKVNQMIPSFSDQQSLSKVEEKLKSCETANEMHHERCDALETNLYRFERRQLKVNDVFSRHLRSLLATTASIWSPDQRTGRKDKQVSHHHPSGRYDALPVDHQRPNDYLKGDHLKSGNPKRSSHHHKSIDLAHHTSSDYLNSHDHHTSRDHRKSRDHQRPHHHTGSDHQANPTINNDDHVHQRNRTGGHQSSDHQKRHDHQLHQKNSQNQLSYDHQLYQSYDGHSRPSTGLAMLDENDMRETSSESDVEYTADMSDEEDLGYCSSPSSASEDHASQVSPHKLHKSHRRYRSVKPVRAVPFSLVHPVNHIPVQRGAVSGHKKTSKRSHLAKKLH